MLEIDLVNASKRYNRDWIFENINYTFTSPGRYAITGNNGSGKSTLLQCIAGSVELKEGSCVWKEGGKRVVPENIFTKFSLAAPYLELVEEMTASEFLIFHASFKPLLKQVSLNEILNVVQLSSAANKQIRYFSSGMKQRLKLAQAIFSDVPVLLLDEPCTNLDEEGFVLYHHLIKEYTKNKLVIVSSNDVNEYSFSENMLDIRDYK